MNDLAKMGVTLLFLPFVGFALFQGILSLRQLFTGFRQEDQRLQRNSVYMIALCFLALVLLYRLWFWLMWQME